MKIAVLFAGRVHGFEECVESQKTYVFQDHDVDVFLAHNMENTHDDLELFRRSYQVDYIRTIKVDTHEYERYPLDLYHGTPTLNCIRMFGCMYEAYRMIPDPYIYDIVVYMRADQLFKGPIEFQTPRPNTVYIPNVDQDHAGGLNDQFAYGTPESMKLYCSTIKRIHTIMNTKLERIHPERLNRISTELAGLTVVRFELSYTLARNRKHISAPSGPFYVDSGFHVIRF